MGFELGALLGNLGDGSQSFDSFPTDTWSVNIVGGPITVTSDNTNTYSSNGSLKSTTTALATFASAEFSHAYASCDDLYQRWWFEVGTHDIATYVSGKVSGGSQNAYLRAGLNGTAVGCYGLATDVYSRYRYSATLNSADNYEIILEVNRPFGGGAQTIHLDDVTTVIDPIQLFPEWDLKLKDELFMTDHQTVGGASPSYVWGFNKKWDVPLTHIEENQARLLNQWWQDMRPLLFTADTSDYTQQFIVTMTNKQTPMNNLSKVYHDEWRGTLELAAYDTSLIF